MFFDYNVQTKNVANPDDDQDATTIVFLEPMHELDPIAWDLIVKPEDRIRVPTKHHEINCSPSRPVKPKKGKGIW